MKPALRLRSAKPCEISGLSSPAGWVHRLRGALLPAFGAALLWLAGGPAPAADLLSSLGPRARIVAVQDSEATQAFEPRLDVVRAMVDRAITNLTGKATVPEAWRSLVRTQDVVGIKVYSSPGPNSGTRPAVVAGVVKGLLAAGLPPQNIIVWDRLASDLRVAGFWGLSNRYGIRLEGSADVGWDENTSYPRPLLGKLVFGDLEFGKEGNGIGRKSFVSKLVSRELTKIINVTPLLNHNLAGVCGNLYSLALGSVDNILRFEFDPEALSEAVPEIYALKELGDHVVLNITDALVCQYEGGERGLLHYSTALNELRFSTDPVALDVLSLQELDNQREAAHAPPVKADRKLYINAGLLDLGVSDPKRILVERLK
ncbi:MAG TPA: DUF362 domain-containing protein [Dongiaceae bacterium]|nr:DUF362 domain-containing protein [Dongiaceae bacterium]